MYLHTHINIHTTRIQSCKVFCSCFVIFAGDVVRDVAVVVVVVDDGVVRL